MRYRRVYTLHTTLADDPLVCAPIPVDPRDCVHYFVEPFTVTVRPRSIFSVGISKRDLEHERTTSSKRLQSSPWPPIRAFDSPFAMLSRSLCFAFFLGVRIASSRHEQTANVPVRNYIDAINRVATTWKVNRDEFENLTKKKNQKRTARHECETRINGIVRCR